MSSLADALRQAGVKQHKRGNVYWIHPGILPFSDAFYQELEWQKKRRPFVVIQGDDLASFRARKTVIVAPCSKSASMEDDARLCKDVSPHNNEDKNLVVKKNACIQISLLFPIPKSILDKAEFVNCISDQDTYREIDLALCRIFGLKHIN